MLLTSSASAFVLTPSTSTRSIVGKTKTTTTTTTTTPRLPISTTAADATSADDNDDKVLSQEALNVENLKASAAALRQWNAQDLERIIADVDNMSPAQAQQFQKMGMDVNVMKETMKMIKDNPSMRENMASVMETLTPEELLEQSRKAQEQLKNYKNDDNNMKDSATQGTKDEQDNDDKDDEDDQDDEPVEVNPAVLDAMYKVGEYMSEPPEKGGVTFTAFCTLPPISILSAGKGGNDDLTSTELKECWNTGSLGATRVDRTGFERVWTAVQDKYYNDIVEEARERILVKRRGRSKPSTTATAVEDPVSSTISTSMTSTPPTPSSSSSSSSSQPTPSSIPDPKLVTEQIKNLKDEDFTKMLEQMSQMTEADEARMRAMGVDPVMMRKSAAMMKNNPLLRKAATAMMKNTSPEQLQKASMEAQAKMANLSPEEKQKLLDSMK